jgi:hypothetical protein
MAKKASQEWFTAEKEADLSLACLGRIDLDPCANPQKSVPAIRHYVGHHGQDGLILPWGEQENGLPTSVWKRPSTLFLNPPWGSIDPWVDRLLSEYEAGHYTDALLLVPVRTERPWFRALRHLPVWFPDERINYLKEQPDGTLKLVKGISTNSCMFYQGEQVEKFERVFSPHGRIYVCRSSERRAA